MNITVENIREAGGIVHSDGNIFFTNIETLQRAILLAASKVDVAGLMELVAKVSNAAYVAGLQDANGEGCDATAQTLFEDELETALRMALAQREWVGLTDDEIHNLDPLPHQMHDQERIDYAKSIEAKLKEKNHG